MSQSVAIVRLATAPNLFRSDSKLILFSNVFSIVGTFVKTVINLQWLLQIAGIQSTGVYMGGAGAQLTLRAKLERSGRPIWRPALPLSLFHGPQALLLFLFYMGTFFSTKSAQNILASSLTILKKKILL